MVSAAGCDSIIYIDLQFNDSIVMQENYSGCTGDGYSITVNNTVYDDTNPNGREQMVSAAGCDSIIYIDLVFNDSIVVQENYSGCTGDGYSITINNTVYDDTNPNGREQMASAAGCDSIIYIDLVFNDSIVVQENYSGCTGDGYSITINNTVYDDTNPNGREQMASAAGCDSIIYIDLQFNDSIVMQENYSGCTGDGYSITVNNTVYDDTNPNGREQMVSAAGCDSIIYIDLVFNDSIVVQENYSGCTGDGYSITINNTVYNEGHPMGVEIMTTNSGCDSVVYIGLIYLESLERQVFYEGCSGDDYFIEINGRRYDESNPSGTELLTGGMACDTLVFIELLFAELIDFEETIEINSNANRVIDISRVLGEVDSIVDIRWTPQELLSCGDCLFPEYLGAEDITLTAEITDTKDCNHQITVNILFTEQLSLYIPNVFSPNNDGVNDIFIPLTNRSTDYSVLSFEIFDRWGEKVFSRRALSMTDRRLGWDGTIRQSEAAPGMYVYVLQLVDGNEITTIRYGEVTLMR